MFCPTQLLVMAQNTLAADPLAEVVEPPALLFVDIRTALSAQASGTTASTMTHRRDAQGCCTLPGVVRAQKGSCVLWTEHDLREYLCGDNSVLMCMSSKTSSVKLIYFDDDDGSSCRTCNYWSNTMMHNRTHGENYTVTSATSSTVTLSEPVRGGRLESTGSAASSEEMIECRLQCNLAFTRTSASHSDGEKTWGLWRPTHSLSFDETLSCTGDCITSIATHPSSMSYIVGMKSGALRIFAPR